MGWRIEFYQEADGKEPVKEFLMGLTIPTRQKIPPKELAVAQRRLKDFLARDKKIKGV